MKNRTHPRISVIIPTRDRKEILSKVLESYRGQDTAPDTFEVLVIDDGSVDGTHDVVDAFAVSSPFAVTYVRQAAGGPARARNAGIERATGRILLFTNDDMVASPQLVGEHLEGHRKWPGSVILGYIDWHPSLKISPFMKYVHRGPQFNFPGIRNEQMNVSYLHFYGSNISLEAEILKGSGPFDESFTEAAFEDIELGYRIWKRGIRTVFCERAVARHLHPTDLASFIHRQLKAGRAAATFYLKHPELEEYLEIPRIANPEFRLAFYDAVLDYYYLVGLIHGLRKEDDSAYAGEALLHVDVDEGIWDGEWKLKMMEELKARDRTIERLESHLEERNRILFKAARALDLLSGVLPGFLIEKLKARIWRND
jgi:glycosyltransferase involved in cell wall biosynthesis